jgi:plastocyanin
MLDLSMERGTLRPLLKPRRNRNTFEVERKADVKRPLIVTFVAAIVLATAAVALAAPRIVKATSTNKWNPIHVSMQAGTAVQWRNPTSRVHDLKSTSKNWDFRRMLDPGERAKRTFGKAGFYKYRCLRHSSVVNGVCKGMCGYIHVAHM